jgi:hypothetical protein
MLTALVVWLALSVGVATVYGLLRWRPRPVHWFAGWLLGPAVKRSQERLPVWPRRRPAILYPVGMGHPYPDGKPEWFISGQSDKERAAIYLAAVEPLMLKLTHHEEQA